jgi:plasmid stability protein
MKTPKTDDKNRVLAECMHCSYDDTMPNITIRDVDPDLHEALKKKAETSGQSLQEYLSRQLVTIATTRTNAEIIAEHRQKMKVMGWTGATREQIDAAIEHMKKERDNGWKRSL